MLIYIPSVKVSRVRFVCKYAQILNACKFAITKLMATNICSINRISNATGRKTWMQFEREQINETLLYNSKCPTARIRNGTNQAANTIYI
ncbi:hypothetical protein ADT25_08275 [Xanthomonas oryzae]|uniref:Uncharacterized protein n=1 Tax=Xanthomonas oryzae TaxID=347 RepID=A0AAP0ZN64_9XANT|nr:hypothetical protein ADT25_08275 [Xanthomonas oryzae]